MSFPSQVRIVEVGPRDGLQNEKKTISTSKKIDFINRLVQRPVVADSSTQIWMPAASSLGLSFCRTREF